MIRTARYMTTKAESMCAFSSNYCILLAVLSLIVVHSSLSTSPTCPIGTEYRDCSWNISCSDIGGVRRCQQQSPCASGCFCANRTVVLDGTCSDINSCSVCPNGTEYRDCSWNISCSDITGVRGCKEQSPCTSGCFCGDGTVLKDGVCSDRSSCPACLNGTEYRDCSWNISCSDITGVRGCKERSPCTSGCFCSDGTVLNNGVCSDMGTCSVCPIGTEYHDCSWNLSCSDITGVRGCKEQSPCTSGCFCSDGTVLQDGVCTNTSSCTVCPSGTEYHGCSWNLSCNDIAGVRGCKEKSPCTSGCFCSDGTVLQDGVCADMNSCSVCPLGTEYRHCGWNISCSDITGVRRCKEQSPCTSGCFCSDGTVLQDGVCSSTSSCLACPNGTEYHDCSWNLSCSDITGVRGCKEQSPCTNGCFCSNGTVLQDGVCTNMSICSVQCPTLMNGNFQCLNESINRQFRDTCIFSCNAGYELQGSNNKSCLANQSWSGGDPMCLSLNCFTSPPLNNSQLQSSCDTQYQSTCTTVCVNGYTGVGGSYTCVVTDEDTNSVGWNGSTSCQRVQCARLTDPANGTISCVLVNNPSFSFEDTCSFTCNTGYELTGSTERTCQSDGSWSGSSVSCIIMECPSSSLPMNSMLAESCSSTYQSMCELQCQEGFTGTGDPSYLCDLLSNRSSVMWMREKDAWICERVQCPTLMYGVLQCPSGVTTGVFEDTCTFSCNAGYELQGSNNGTCLANQSWSGGDPLCIALNCSTSPPLNNSQLQSSCDTQYQSTCATVCVDGYTGVGGSYTCVVTDEDTNSVGWIGSTSCQRVQCVELTDPTNGSISCVLVNDPSFSFEDTCSFTCNTGYELTGSTEKTCQSDGSWSGSPVSCIIMECPSSSLPMNSMLVESCSSTYQSMCELQCQEGFTGTGDPSYVCDVLSNRSSVMWMREKDAWICERVQCPTLMYGVLQCPSGVTTGVFEDTCTFSCNAGYELQGSNNGTCLANQSWSGGDPLCIALNCSTSPPLNNSQLQSSCDTQYQSTCATVCVDGYTGVGGSYTCVVTDEDTNSVGWIGSTSCQRVQCVELTDPTNGSISCVLVNDPSFSFEDTCSFTCNTGYELTGSTEKTCQSDGSWSGSPVSCIIMECPSSSLPMNSMLVESCSSTYQSMCELQCQEGFTGTGDPSYVCDVLSNGSSVMWMTEEDAWICERVRCPTLMNGVLQCPNGATTGVFEDTCTFSCNAGYELQGSNNRTCLANQSWSGGNPICVALNCSTSPPLNNSRLQSSCDRQYQSTCTTVCVDGYTGVGGSYTCVVTNVDTNSVGWNGSTSCQRVQCTELIDPTNGTMSCALITDPLFSYEDTCSFTCNTGFELTGSTERTCQSDGSWSGSPVSCIIMECPSSSLPMNSMLTESCSSTYQSMCELQCQEGFTGTGDSSYVCDVGNNALSVTWVGTGVAWRCEKACPVGTQYRDCSWNISCSDVTGVRRCKESSSCMSGCFCYNGTVLQDGVCSNISSCLVMTLSTSTLVLSTNDDVMSSTPIITSSSVSTITSLIIVSSSNITDMILSSTCTSSAFSSISTSVLTSSSVSITSSPASIIIPLDSTTDVMSSSTPTTYTSSVFTNSSTSISIIFSASKSVLSILPSVSSAKISTNLGIVVATAEITAATADTSSSGESGSVSVATIGGAIGGIAIFAIIIVLCVVVCCIIRSKRNKRESFKIEANNAIYYNKTYDNVENVRNDKVNDAVNTDLQLQDRNATASSIISNRPSVLESQSSFIHSSAEVPVPMHNEWGNILAKCLIDYNTLMMEKEIAKGNFGVVYKGKCTKGNETVEVAIKTMRDVSLSNAKEFTDECIMANNFKHPNVLSIIGVSINPDDNTPLMVMPFMHNGSVQSYVKSKRGNTVNFSSFPKDLNHDMLMQLCLDIAKGMEYLSSRHFVHRDLAARNCMLDQSMRVKVADFGLARDIYTDSYYTSANRRKPLPIKWLAPESLLDRIFTEKTDVWAFGVTCWEVFSLGLHPYPKISASEAFDYVKDGGVLDRPSLSSDEMYKVMKSCWIYSPEERPSFTALVQNISQQLGQIDDELYLLVQ